MTLEEIVTAIAILLACASFIAFCVLAHEQSKAAEKASDNIKEAVKVRPGVDAIADLDIPKLLESAAKLVDGLAKAGPSLSALLASVLFLSIAAYTAKKPSIPDPGKPGTSESKQGVSPPTQPVK